LESRNGLNKSRRSLEDCDGQCKELYGVSNVAKPKQAGNADLPYMTIFIGDYLADTADLTLEEQGAYFRLLAAMWWTKGWIPDDDMAIGRVLGCGTRAWRRIKPRLLRLLTIENGEITQERLLKELVRGQLRSRKQSDIAKYPRKPCRYPVNNLSSTRRNRDLVETKSKLNGHNSVVISNKINNYTLAPHPHPYIEQNKSETSPSPLNEASVSPEKKNGLQGVRDEIQSTIPKSPPEGQFFEPKLAAAVENLKRRRNKYEAG
jgi:uncharacterized protein YdaU (DUF1376 family)